MYDAARGDADTFELLLSSGAIFNVTVGNNETLVNHGKTSSSGWHNSQSTLAAGVVARDSSIFHKKTKQTFERVQKTGLPPALQDDVTRKRFINSGLDHKCECGQLIIDW